MMDHSLPRLTEQNLKQLADFGYCVSTQFIETKELRDDLLSLRNQAHFSVSRIGHDGQIQDAATPFRDIRHSETCSLWDIDHMDSTLPSNAARDCVVSVLQQLKSDLASSVDDQIVDPHIQEAMYAYYPEGGYYRRHVDAEADSSSSFRTYSFLLYLSEWDEKQWGGGCLRLHFDNGMDHLPPDELPNFIDVPPKAGTLVVFRSCQVPHEVMTSYASERLALVGWFWSRTSSSTDITSRSRTQFPHNTIAIDAASQSALERLRERVPSLQCKLAPQIEYQSGLLNESNDAWGIIAPSVPIKAPNGAMGCDDTSPCYWVKVARFDISGNLATLSLGGVRLHNVDGLSSTLKPLMAHLTTLDLSNTDVDPLVTVSLLKVTRCLKNLYLGGNSWPRISSVFDVANAIPDTVEVVDFRYSNWSGDHLEAFLSAVETSTSSRLEKLYLEGNPMGDSAMETLSAALAQLKLRELFLGSCKIGSPGALKLAATRSLHLKKLYLEGNSIGSAGAQAFLGSRLIGVVQNLYLDNNDIPKNLAMKVAQAIKSPTMIGDGGIYEDS